MTNPIKTLLRKAYFSKALNRWAVRLYCTIYPPPYCRDKMEFDYDVWNGISTFRSQDGRQIGENNTSPEIYKEVVETEHKLCKFEGSRRGLMINVTALRNTLTVWDETLQFATLLRKQYISHRRLSSERFNLRQGYVYSKMTAAYVAYLARRTNNPIKSGSLPPLETAFFTLGVGPFMIVRALMEKGDLSVLSEQPMDGEHLYHLADSSGTLISAAGKGCAGSKKLIVDFVDVAMNGSYTKPLISPEAQRAFCRIDNWEEFFKYVYASSRLELLIRLTQILCAQSLLSLQSDSRRLNDSDRELLGQSLTCCYGKVADPPHDRMVMSNFVVIALTLLDELECPAVRISLVEAGLIQTSEGCSASTEAKGNDISKAAAMRMRRSTQLLYPYCCAELRSIDESLGRSGAKSISLEDLYARCCGNGLELLLASIES